MMSLSFLPHTTINSISTMPPKKKRVKVESEDEDPDFTLSPEKSKPNKSASKSSKATNSIPDKSQSSLKSFFSPAGTSNPPSNPFKSPNKPNKKPKLSQERDEDLEWAINESLKMAAATQGGDDKGVGGSSTSRPLFLPDADDLDQDDDLDLDLEDQEMEEVEENQNKAGKGKAEQSSNQIIEILDSDDDQTSSSTSQSHESKRNSKGKGKGKGKKKEDSGYGGSSEEGSPSAISSKLEQDTGDFVSCPSCSKKIESQDAQNHVNACLDELMDEKPQSKTASRKKSTSPLKADQDSSKQASSSGVVDDFKKSSSKPSLESTSKKNLNSSSTSCTPSDPSIPMKPISELASLFTKQTSSSSSDNQTSINPEPKAATASTSSNPTKNAPANAFTKLMTSHLHTKEWLSADAVEAQNSTRKGKNRARREGNVMAPFYKILEGMPICVDGFRFGEIKGCQAFFLTHFHSDHYGGITANWTHGPIYGSITTCNLVKTSLGVDPKWIRPLPMETSTEIPFTGGVKVTCIEANHCPGSCLFLFEGPRTKWILKDTSGGKTTAAQGGRDYRYLHCGDFRASPLHATHPLVHNRHLDIIYLDTTYLNPRYCFPAQEQVVLACADLVRSAMPLVTEGEPNWDEDEDWRIAPPRKGQVNEVDRKAGIALRGWLDKRGKGNDPSGKGKVKEEDEDEFGFNDDDELPELEDEDSLRAKGKLQEMDLPAGADEDDTADFDLLEEAEVAEEGEGSTILDSPSEDSEMKRPGETKVKVEEEDDSKPSGIDTGEAPSAEELLEAAMKEEEEEAKVRGTLFKTTTASILNKSPSKIKSEDNSTTSSSSNWLTKASESRSSTKKPNGRLLVLVGTYTIGKEKIVKACAQAMNTKVFCSDSRKYKTYAQLDDPELHGLLTRNPRAGVHVTNLGAINGVTLRDMVSALNARGHNFTHAIALRPTGWSFKPPSGIELMASDLNKVINWNQSRNFDMSGFTSTRDSTSDFMIYGVPYSEHSSFFELTAFALSVSYTRIIPTVNVGSPNSRAKMQRWIDKWAGEKRRLKEKDEKEEKERQKRYGKVKAKEVGEEIKRKKGLVVRARAREYW